MTAEAGHVDMGRDETGLAHRGATEPTRPARVRYGVVVFDQRLVTRLVVATIVLLLVGSFVAYAVLWDLEGEAVESLTRLFNVDEENNFPTWFSSSLLLLVALSLHHAAQQAERFQTRLRLVALGFVGLSIDETAQIHEMGNRAVALATGYVDNRPLWLVPAVVLVALSLWYALPVWRSLRPDARRLWAFGVAAFVGGSVGVELLGAPFWELEAVGFANEQGARMGYAALVTLEEGLEMLGGLFFLLGAWRMAEPGVLHHDVEERQ